MSAGTWPVIEVFGPTIQGEGIDQGLPCAFVRFGGCDYACSWCDTPHAVIASEVRENARRMSASDIIESLDALETHGSLINWVVLSGGNPALHDLSPLLMQLDRHGYMSSVETQGSRWKDWLGQVDRLCVSPKPPSSGMGDNLDQVAAFMDNALNAQALRQGPGWVFLKAVVFDEADLDYAVRVHRTWRGVPMFLSAGNDAGRTVGSPDRVDGRNIHAVREQLLDRSAWLVNEVLKRPSLRDVRVQSQYHVLLWGNVQGV